MRRLVLGTVERLAGATVAARVDLIRSTGLRHALYRRRDRPRRDALRAARARLYLEIWREAADAVGASLIELPSAFLELAQDGRTTRVWQQWVMLDDAVTVRLALDKPAVSELLARGGIPVAEHVEVPSGRPQTALEFLEQAGGPCVVKPAGGGGGESVTSGVETAADLRRALLRASRHDDRILVERHLPGEVYRLLLLDGELLDVLHRLPPRVVGDGRSTVHELVAAENERRLAAEGRAGLELLGVDLDSILCLRRAGLGLGSVPPSGTLVTVKGTTNENAAEDNETLREPVADGLVAEAAAAAAAVGVRLAGVDVITADPTRPLAETGGAVLEVNATPGLHHHYLVADAERATRVAIPVLRKLLSG